MHPSLEIVLDVPARSATASTRRRIGLELGERLAAAVILCLIMPLLVVVGLITIVLSRRSPLIRHERVGRGNNTISVLKIRTMWNHSPAAELVAPETEVTAERFGCRAKLATDPRITSRFAAVSRRYSLDELPQLWNVLRGDMALVGPRPLTRWELELFYGNDAAEVLSMKPGLTGLWQIRGRSRLSYRRRRRLDLFLIRHWSLRLYLFILFTTVPKVLLGRDAW
jgi:lipopolysaccharide/colanic/teichoic acid biosynthesis glycosyltransferase